MLVRTRGGGGGGGGRAAAAGAQPIGVGVGVGEREGAGIPTVLGVGREGTTAETGGRAAASSVATVAKIGSLTA